MCVVAHALSVKHLNLYEVYMSAVAPPRMRVIISGLLTNRWAISCLIVLAIQQIIEASSTLWLVKLIESITLGESFFPYLILYISSLALPYIPSCIAQILKASWKQETQRSFINTFIGSNKNNITEWSNKGIKEEKLSILTSEGPLALQSLVDYVWDLFTYVLSVFLNILALSIAVEPLFAVAYGVSVCCVIVVMKMKRIKQRQLTQKALIARVDLCQSLRAAWDNVLLGNDYNFKLWHERTFQRLKRCLQRNVDLERFDQILAIFVALITAIPSLGVVFYFFTIHQKDTARLTSLVVILPLLFMILSYTYQTLSLAFRWAMHRSKLTTIYRIILASTATNQVMEKKIQWSKITGTHFAGPAEESVSLAMPQPFTSHEDLLDRTFRSGRLTLRGENGSGKSTALMLIKNALSDRAFFLPTQNQLSFTSETNKYSTGESLRKRLIEILEKVDADVLLLDEWDANLDKDNQEQLSSLIDQLSDRKCVIEVRHR